MLGYTMHRACDQQEAEMHPTLQVRLWELGRRPTEDKVCLYSSVEQYLAHSALLH